MLNTLDNKGTIDELATYFCDHPDQAALKDKINGDIIFHNKELAMGIYLNHLSVIIGSIKSFFEHYLRFFVFKGIDLFALQDSPKNEEYSDWYNALYSIVSKTKRMDQLVRSFLKTNRNGDFVNYFYICLKNELQSNGYKENIYSNGLSGYKDHTLALFKKIRKYLGQTGTTTSDAELFNNTELMRLLGIKKEITFAKLLQEYQAFQKTQSLDQPIYDKEGATHFCIGDTIEDKSAEQALYQSITPTSSLCIKEYLNGMDPKRRRDFMIVYTNNAFLESVNKRFNNLTYLQAYRKDSKGIINILRELYSCGFYSKEVIIHYLKHPQKKLSLEIIGKACNKSKQLMSINYKKEAEKLAAYLKEKIKD